MGSLRIVAGGHVRKRPAQHVWFPCGSMENTGINEPSAFFEFKTEHSVPSREQHGKLGLFRGSSNQDQLPGETFPEILPH
ncbi:MAG: hypothetical protein CMJ81_23255 [Planctomycetaceae bacterium]|nr:hypothetical protein [Planctomycetaceae bacterium]MBP61857.1 hypothetical protein [Planctomycetaceae bacterium]